VKMEQGFSILMLIFSAAILFYALIIGWTKDIKLIARHYAIKTKNKKKYAVQFAKLLALVSIAPAMSGIVGLFTDNVFIVIGSLVISFIVCLKFGLRLMKDKLR